MRFETGNKVKWNDVAISDFKGKERELQESRVYEVIEYINDDMVLIADEYGEGEVFEDELELYLTDDEIIAIADERGIEYDAFCLINFVREQIPNGLSIDDILDEYEHLETY